MQLKFFAVLAMIAALLTGSLKMYAKFNPEEYQHYLLIDGVEYGKLPKNFSFNELPSNKNTFKIKKMMNSKQSLFYWAKTSNKKSSIAKSFVEISKKTSDGKIVDKKSFANCKAIFWEMQELDNKQIIESVDIAFGNYIQ